MTDVCVMKDYDAQKVELLIQQQKFFWLDLANPSEEVIETLARDLAWPEMLVRDLHHRQQRPKLDDYDGQTLIVFYGLSDNEPAEAREVHLVISSDWVITLREQDCPPLDLLHKRVRQRERSESYLVYRILDALSDSFFPALDRIDLAIDELEDEIIKSPNDEQLAALFALKHELVSVRRITGPQRDLAAHALERLDEIDGLEADAHDWYRDVYDHMLRASELVDSYRDLLSGLMDIYLSTVSNRLNIVMKQLALVATIFMPLSFLVGFFGMNFAWMVRGLSSSLAFVSLGLVPLLISAIGCWFYFRRQGWLN